MEKKKEDMDIMKEIFYDLKANKKSFNRKNIIGHPLFCQLKNKQIFLEDRKVSLHAIDVHTSQNVEKNILIEINNIGLDLDNEKTHFIYQKTLEHFVRELLIIKECMKEEASQKERKRRLFVSDFRKWFKNTFGKTFQNVGKFNPDMN